MAGIAERPPVKKKTECSICLCQPDKPRVLECGHAFHSRCIKRWVYASGAAVCPLCRQACYEILQSASLSRKVEFLENTTGGPPNGHFWPAWLVGQVTSNPGGMFTEEEQRDIIALAYQSFNKETFHGLISLL